MIQFFFDTNIWFDYCWARRHRKRFGKGCIPINKINSRKAKIILTDPLIYEVSSLFKERYLIKYAIDEGISAFEVRRIKRGFNLKRKDRKEVDKLIENNIYSLSVSKDQWLIDWLDQNTLNEILRTTSIYDIEFMDCLHIMAALSAGCDVFVTKDEQLISGFIRASKKRASFRKLKIMRPKEFMNFYQKTIFKSKS